MNGLFLTRRRFLRGGAAMGIAMTSDSFFRASTSHAAAAPSDYPIVELRQYTLHPGKRDVLIELFERELVESQEAVGMRIVGQFRDADDPNRYVWLRAFHDMPSRAAGLNAFYSGPVWKAHREAANATMVDSDNVLLLHQARPTSGFPPPGERPPPGARELPKGFITATIYPLRAPAREDLIAFFERNIAPAATAAGASVLAYFVTENSPNDFPKLPVRDEQVFVWFSLFADRAAFDRYSVSLVQSPRWEGEVVPALARYLRGPAEVRKLLPAARSMLHG